MGVLYGEGKKIEEDPNKIIDSNNPVLQSWESSDRTDFHSNEYRSKITKAKFAICDKVPENKIESWDVSEAKNKSVMAWVESDGADGYILTIASKTKIIANPISNYIFYQMTNLTEIENIEVLDTSMVKQFDSMFRNCENLTNLDLSSLSFKNVKSVRYMFSGCINLNNLKLSEINYKSGIDNSIEFWSMFYNCKKLSTTLSIRFNSGIIYTITSTGMFEGAATEPGAKIVVKCNLQEKFIDELIATKSANSNVVKELLQ